MLSSVPDNNVFETVKEVRWLSKLLRKSLWPFEFWLWQNKFYDPELSSTPLVGIPESLNPFATDGVKIYAKLHSALPAGNVKSLPGETVRFPFSQISVLATLLWRSNFFFSALNMLKNAGIESPDSKIKKVVEYSWVVWVWFLSPIVCVSSDLIFVSITDLVLLPCLSLSLAMCTELQRIWKLICQTRLLKQSSSWWGFMESIFDCLAVPVSRELTRNRHQ